MAVFGKSTQRSKNEISNIETSTDAATNINLVIRNKKFSGNKNIISDYRKIKKGENIILNNMSDISGGNNTDMLRSVGMLSAKDKDVSENT